MIIKKESRDDLSFFKERINKVIAITERKCKTCGETKPVAEMYNRTICLECLG